MDGSPRSRRPLYMFTNFSREVDWFRLLEELQSTPASTALPCTARCPVCRTGALTTYQDTICKSRWHYCTGCHFRGDSIELAMAVWRLDLTDTIRRLEACGLLAGISSQESDLDNYRRRGIQQRRHTEQWWEKISAAMPIYSDDLQAFHLQARATVGGDPQRWKTRVGHFLAAADKDEVIRESGRQCKDYTVVFGRQRYWRRTWVIPMRDLPGRIPGFTYVIGDNENVYKAVNMEQGVYLPGLAMLESLAGFNHELQDAAFALLDVNTAVRLHIAWASQYSTPLPLVGLWPQSIPCPYLWQHSPGRRLYMWAERPDKYTFHHARTAGAMLAARQSSEPIHKTLRRQSPMAWLVELMQAARPWQEVLATEAARMGPAELEEIIRYLDMTAHDTDQLLEVCGATVRERIRRLYKTETLQRKAVINKQVVVEAAGGWRLEKNGELICDMLIRLDQVVHQSHLKRSFYRGVVTYRGQEVPFLAPKKNFEAKPLAWLANHLEQNNIGSPLFNKRWQASALNIAKQFHQPDVVRGMDTYGWDAQQGYFAFPTFAIKPGGQVVDHTIPQLNDRGNHTRFPAQQLRKPEPLTPADMAVLKAHPDQARLLWLVAGLLLYDLLAPLRNYQRKGLVVTGDGEAVIDIAKALGCIVVRYIQPCAKEGSAYTDLESFGWPIALPHRNWATRSDWLVEDGRNCLVAGADDVAALLLRANGNWIAAHGPPSCPLDPEILVTAVKIIPGLFRHVAAQTADCSHASGVKRVFHDLAGWFAAEGGDPGQIYRACNHVLHGSQAVAFAELVAQLYLDNEIGWERTDMPSKKSRDVSLYFIPEEKLLWLPRDGLLEVLKKLRKPPLDVTAVTQALAATGELREERALDGPGWTVTERWWEKAFGRRRRVEELKKAVS